MKFSQTKPEDVKVIQAGGNQKSSKATSTVTLHSKNSSALTFPEFEQAGGTTQRASGIATARSSGNKFQNCFVQSKNTRALTYETSF